eukprot:1103808-Pelagomonas_calceolata.AAC.7
MKGKFSVAIDYPTIKHYRRRQVFIRSFACAQQQGDDWKRYQSIAKMMGVRNVYDFLYVVEADLKGLGTVNNENSLIPPQSCIAIAKTRRQARLSGWNERDE